MKLKKQTDSVAVMVSRFSLCEFFMWNYVEHRAYCKLSDTNPHLKKELHRFIVPTTQETLQELYKYLDDVVYFIIY